jgi:glycosyltransferase involved in cell wall biosynthesis
MGPSPEEKQIRVLHIITRMIQGGAQENTLLTVEGLNQKGQFRTTLLSGVDHGPEGELLSRVRETTPLIIVPQLGRAISPLADLIALVKLYRIIRAGRYHIVHTHSSKAGVLGRIAAKLAGTPFIVHTIHGLAFHDYQPWLENRLWRAVERACAPITDHYVSVSGIISQKAIAAGIGRSEKFTTIYSGMELDWFLHAKADSAAIRREFGIPADAPVVGKISRLFPLKGHEQLLDAVPEVVRRHPAVRFFLIGDGILYESLRNRAREEGILENLVFAGLTPRERIPEMLGAVDVVVHTSLREGLARALPQALAMGKPCVSYDLDGAPEVIIPGQTGFLVKPGDVAGLADAISRLLSDPELRARMGAAGRQLVGHNFRAETMVERTAALYSMLLQRHPERLRAFRERANANHVR